MALLVAIVKSGDSFDECFAVVHKYFAA
jgi:hypothetical protein